MNQERRICLDREWFFRTEPYKYFEALRRSAEGRTVDLPHDYMVENGVDPSAPAAAAMGYYNASAASYTKQLFIPEEWSGEKLLLCFDGAMMNATVEVNGSFVCLQHYGYVPFEADITPYVVLGAENRITVTTNPGMQPNSRWYTGAGLYRSVSLLRLPALHILPYGIYAYTKRLDTNAEGTAYLEICVTMENDLPEGRLVEVEAELIPETFEGAKLTRRTTVFVEAGGRITARVPMTVKDPELWSDSHPELYRVQARIREQGVFRTTLIPAGEAAVTDQDSVLFGIRTVSADALHGLRINGHTVKLRSGCLHHDNGILGAVSLYDSEYRKLKILKDGGFNAVRTAHNPPSAVFLEACDRLGLYVIDEAFDAWRMDKKPGDYSQYFDQCWKEDLRAFIERDRCHPSVILWSTGNEIPERGGLGNGYSLSHELAEYVRSLDATRPVTNGMCSYWNGLDDRTQTEIAARLNSGESYQNAQLETAEFFEERSEAFLESLDVVGYNYLESYYERTAERYPERVIVGTESLPAEMDRIWELVERLPYVIGDFTWTCYDYIGEAGIGKSMFVPADSGNREETPQALASELSQYPWRLANDADYDITGRMTPQGAYRRVVWGSGDTFVYAQDPARFGHREIISRWGWPELYSCWNWAGREGKDIRVVVYSAAEEVRLCLNGVLVGQKAAGKGNRYTAVFDITYEKGTLEAVSLEAGREVSRAVLSSTGEPAALRLTAEEEKIKADGKSLSHIRVHVVDAQGRTIPDASCPIMVEVSGAARLQGFGSAAPVTEENYRSGEFTSCHGTALAVIRAGYEPGEAIVRARSCGLREAVLTVTVGA